MVWRTFFQRYHQWAFWMAMSPCESNTPIKFEMTMASMCAPLSIMKLIKVALDKSVCILHNVNISETRQNTVKMYINVLKIYLLIFIFYLCDFVFLWRLCIHCFFFLWVCVFHSAQYVCCDTCFLYSVNISICVSNFVWLDTFLCK